MRIIMLSSIARTGFGRSGSGFILRLWVIVVAGAVRLSAAEPPVTSIAFAPDGESVIAGSQAGLSVYGWPSLVESRKIECSLAGIHDLAFSRDGKILAVAGGVPAEEGRVELRNWPAGDLQNELGGHEDTVTSVEWVDDRRLATASLDHTVAVWDLGSGERLHHLRGHSKGVATLGVLHDQVTLLSGGLDNSLRVWDIRSEAVTRSLDNHTRRIHQLAVRPFSSALPMVATVSADRTVRFWQPTIGRMVRFRRLDSAPLSLAWSSDGRKLAVSCGDGSVRLLDPETAEMVADYSAVNGWAYALAVHPTDGSLVVGGQNGQLQRVLVAGTQ